MPKKKRRCNTAIERNRGGIPSSCSIRFKNGDLSALRNRLLSDLSREQFAVLLGKTEEIDVSQYMTLYIPTNWILRIPVLYH